MPQPNRFVTARITLRRGTASEWTSNNTILLDGELGLESDTRSIKLGDGTTPWTQLDYWGAVANLSGDVTIGGNLTVNANATISGLLTADDITVQDDLTVGDDLTVNDDTLIKGDLTVEGKTFLGDDLTISDGTILGDLNSFMSALGWTEPSDATPPPAWSETYSMEFDNPPGTSASSSGYVSIPADPAINFSGDMTLSAWVKFTDISSIAFDSIIAVRPSNTSNQFNLMMSNTGTFRFFTGGILDAVTVVSADTWYHVMVIVKSGVTNGAQIYVNGTLEGTATLTISSATGPLEMGGLPTAFNSYYMAGILSEVAIWNSDLGATHSQCVADIYNSGAPTDISSFSPDGWWRMGEGATWDGTNWTIPDESSNNNSATSTNIAQADRVTDVPS